MTVYEKGKKIKGSKGVWVAEIGAGGEGEGDAHPRSPLRAWRAC